MWVSSVLCESIAAYLRNNLDSFQYYDREDDADTLPCDSTILAHHSLPALVAVIRETSLSLDAQRGVVGAIDRAVCANKR